MKYVRTTPVEAEQYDGSQRMLNEHPFLRKFKPGDWLVRLGFNTIQALTEEQFRANYSEVEDDD